MLFNIHVCFLAFCISFAKTVAKSWGSKDFEKSINVGRMYLNFERKSLLRLILLKSLLRRRFNLFFSDNANNFSFIKTVVFFLLKLFFWNRSVWFVLKLYRLPIDLLKIFFLISMRTPMFFQKLIFFFFSDWKSQTKIIFIFIKI